MRELVKEDLLRFDGTKPSGAASVSLIFNDEELYDAVSTYVREEM
jgi:hypothetical protein